MFTIANEVPADAGEIETVLDRAFGPGRHGKTVYRLRDGVAAVDELCFTLRRDAQLLATIRFWPIEIGGRVPALLLGPIAVEPAQQGNGYGVTLMRHSLAAARDLGHGIVILVGDAGYYEKFGFSRSATERLRLPGPVDLARFLGLELVPGALDGIAGMIGKARCLRAA